MHFEKDAGICIFSTDNLNQKVMEKTILLHCLSVEELKELIQEAVRKEL